MDLPFMADFWKGLGLQPKLLNSIAI